MLRSFSLLALALPFANGIRLATWNLRYDSQPDSISVSDSLSNLPSPLDEPDYLAISDGSEQPWSSRRIRVAEWLQRNQVDAFGVQEALVRQVTDLQDLFGSDWANVGVGRDDGKESGEYSALFWNTNSLNLVSNDTFWLSNTPLEPSKYPGAGNPRLVTYAQFQTQGKNVTLMNTHFDDISNDQRMFGASMLLARARYEAVHSGGAVFVLGDFNSPPRGNASEGYSIITGALPPVDTINSTWAATYSVDDDQEPDFVMKDLRGEAPTARVSETYATYTGFTASDDTSVWQRIDFFFGGSNGHWNAQAYAVDDARCDDGMLMSDHRPTVVDLDI